MSNVKIYKCFIASPSNTMDERKVCDTVFREINKGLGEKFNFRIESVKWENDATPDFASEPQQVINDQLFKEKDIKIFIGIMYHHFGTPTKHYGSGTEEEFYQAHAIYEKNPENIKIKFYFNNAPIKLSKINNEQSEKVTEFKQLISELGGLYAMYKGVNDFEKKLRHDLFNYFSKICSESIQLKTDQIDNKGSESKQLVQRHLEEKLNEALLNYEDQPIIWVDRSLYRIKNTGKPFDHDEKIEIPDLIKKPYSLFIHAPPRFGLTCLAHHLVFKAWESGYTWIYLDAQKRMWTPETIKKNVTKACRQLNRSIDSLSCLILDNWHQEGEGMEKTLKNLDNLYVDTPIFVMSTDENVNTGQEIKTNRDFVHTGLLPLTRKRIREIVAAYNSQIHIEEDNAVLNKITTDLENLNIHRTPEHCLTLLKIFEKSFKDTPVNRTKMISMILSVLFDFTKRPSYSTKPDVEHCEFVLGFFCEKLIRKSTYSFDKDHFFLVSTNFINENKIDLDINTVFQILHNNRIIIENGSKFRFRHVFWIYYFAAKRMHQSKDFRKHIIDDEKYLSFIEVIEFYTGIDRNQNDLIDTLTYDLHTHCDNIEHETGISAKFNPLHSLVKFDSENIEESFERIKKEVIESKLPETIKDEYADLHYDITKPSNQNIYEFYKDYKFLSLKRKIHACCRALRNSDFIEPDKKTILLNEIFRGWSLFSRITFALSPIFAKYNEVHWEGYGFLLNSELSKMNFDEKISMLLETNICNIVMLFEEDLHSDRLSTILLEKYESNKDPLIQHQLVTFLIHKKPACWVQIIKNYIESVNKKSFYFADTRNILLHSYRYGWANSKQINDMEKLIYLWYAKKITKTKHLTDTVKTITKSKHSTKKMFGIELPPRVAED